jgi:hypothetical protein
MSSVRKISLVRKDGGGEVSRTVLFENRPKKKKMSTGLKFVERAVRRAAEAEDAFSSEYLARHRKSNEQKRDGWLRDLDDNLSRAMRKGSKKVTVTKVFGL